MRIQHKVFLVRTHKGENIQTKTVIKPQPVIRSVAEFIFYGNYFYGICVVAIMLETALQLEVPYDGAFLYFVSFVATVLFYNYPYARNYASTSHNPRTKWHFRNRRFVRKNQVVFTTVLLVSLVWFIVNNSSTIKRMTVIHWFLLLIFPIAGALYYGLNVITSKYNLRRVGWLKPFVIGFVWAGVATIYPVLYYDIMHSKEYAFSLFGNLLFVKSFMFISILAIMFDVKDYAADSNNRLNTLVVKIGLRKTIFYVLLPLPVLGILTFLSYALTHQFSFFKMVLIMIPFFLLLAAANSLRKRRTLMYYLVVIDGLILIKAVFDILATFV